MTDQKDTQHEVRATGALNYAFLEQDFQELFMDYAVNKKPMVDVAVQTEAKPSSAIKLMMFEVWKLRTADEAEAYRKQLAIAFEQLNLMNASLVHRVEFRKIAKWQPVRGIAAPPLRLEEDFGCTCRDGTLDMRCPKNFGLHKVSRKW